MDPNSMIVYLLVAVNILSIFVCHAVAQSRGTKPVFWGLMGAIFGPLAIPFAYRSQPRED